MISSATIFFLPILLLSSLTFAASQLTSPLLLPSTAPISPSVACNATTDPIFCRSILPPWGTRPLYSYGIFSLSRSLSNSVKTLSIINPFLARRSALPAATAGALEDCKLLASLNIDFLTTAVAALNSTSAILLDPEAELFHTLLSAILTNQQTCLDGLIEADKANAVAAVLTPFLANGIKLYGLSLGLFVKAWSPNRKIMIASSQRNSGNLALLQTPMKEKHLLFHEVRASYDGRLLLKMSEKNQAVFEGRLGRGLLQAANSIQISDMVVVSPDGTEDFITISDAVASAPNNTNGTDGYYLILVRAGTYQEYVSVPKKKRYIMMIGDGINQTIVTGNRNVIDGSNTSTFNSATFAVVGQGFVAINMTFKNTAGAVKHQAVALRSNADLSSFYLCSFEGYQDTLYTHSLRQFYTQCDIYGTVDYIFGNAAVVFQNCNFYSRLPLTGQKNTIIAQGRIDPNQNTGTSIQGGSFLAAPDLAANIGTTSTYLGRPWKQYSRTIIMSAFMDELIQPAGWFPWDGDFALSTLYYAEYNNYGPGSNTSGRVTWPGYHVLTNSTDALNFTVGNFILGDTWLPQTGVPYTSDML